MRDQFSADPTIVFMTSVLEEVARGRLQIPRFQRPLVWDWSQRRDLLSSILEGLPIGALMIWLSSSENVERYRKLGPYDLPEPPQGNNRYLMDGVQRISTLFGAFHAHNNWSEFDSSIDGIVTDYSVFADLDAVDDTERFVRAHDITHDQSNPDRSRFMSLRYVLDDHGLLRFHRSHPEGYEHRIDVADRVVTAFRRYKIPLITLENASLETVTKSFQRVNSRGAVMSEMHMLNALTYSPKFDLLSLENSYRRDELSTVGWEELDQDVILRALKMRLDVELYKPNPEDASRKLKDNPSAIEEVFIGLKNAAKFFHDEIRLESPDLIPYRLQLICIGAVMASVISEKQRASLVDWFWMTTYTEAFGLSARQSEVAISDLRRFIFAGKFDWTLKQRPIVRDPRGRRADFRSARGRALALALARRMDQVTTSSGSKLLNKYKKDCFIAIGEGSASRGRIGSRFLLPPTEKNIFQKDLLSGGLSVEQQDMHLISVRSLELLATSGLDAFYLNREAEVFAFEKSNVFGPALLNLGLNLTDICEIDTNWEEEVVID